jgi:hypothetical protein
MTRFRIERFDPATQIKEHRSILFVGRSGAGKSTCLMDWLRQLAPRFWCAVFFSPTLESAIQFKQIAPSAFVYETALDTDVVAKLLEIQKELLREGKERSILLCCDDSGFSKSTWRQDAIRALHMNGRHLRITFINCIQYVMDIPPDIRTQYSYVVATSENVHSNKKRLHQAFFGCIEQYSAFNQTFSQVTKDFKVAVLDQTDPSAEITNQLFWYKAALKGPKFTIGKSSFWMIQEEHCKKKRSATALSIVGAPQRSAMMDAI